MHLLHSRCSQVGTTLAENIFYVDAVLSLLRNALLPVAGMTKLLGVMFPFSTCYVGPAPACFCTMLPVQILTALSIWT